MSVWRGSAFSGGGLAEKKCFQLALAYAARVTPTAASVLTRVSRTTTTKVFNYFRAAEATKGFALREETIFEGRPDAPAEVSFGSGVAYQSLSGRWTGSVSIYIGPVPGGPAGVQTDATAKKSRRCYTGAAEANGTKTLKLPIWYLVIKIPSIWLNLNDQIPNWQFGGLVPLASLAPV